MAKPQETFKLRVNVHGQEFEAEGQPELVNRQFEAFRLMIQDVDADRTVPTRSTEADHPKPSGESSLAALFRMTPHNQRLSLREPPRGHSPQADTALLLLLGYKQLRNEEEVPVTVLTEALKQSGCPVKRLDRALTVSTKDHSVIRSGRGKGGKYRLTNLGIKKAEAIAREATRDERRA